jgi:hypothetical protein
MHAFVGQDAALVVLGESIGRPREIMFRRGCEARRKYLSAWTLSGHLCSGGDLNPHAFRHTPLKRTCLPFHHPSDSEERNLYHGRCYPQVFRSAFILHRSSLGRTQGLQPILKPQGLIYFAPTALHPPNAERRTLNAERRTLNAYGGGITAILIPFRAQACSSTLGQSSSANSSVTISFTLILPLSR